MLLKGTVHRIKIKMCVLTVVLELSFSVKSLELISKAVKPHANHSDIKYYQCVGPVGHVIVLNRSRV